MKFGLSALSIAAVTLVALTACNQTSQTSQPTAAAAPVGCKGEIGEYQAVMDNDKQMGHVNTTVYNRVVNEIDKASAACDAGRDAEASRLINATKSRYGYR